MKRIILIVSILTLLAMPLYSQDNADEPVVKLPDAMMEQVVRRIVAWYFKAPKKQKTIYLAANNIKKEWLPEIDNIDFVLLEKQNEHYEWSAYLFRNLEKEGKHFRLRFGFGDPGCYGRGDVWAFRVHNSRVKLWRTGDRWFARCDSFD